MGFLSRVSTVARPRMRAEGGGAVSHSQAFFAGDDMPGSWASMLGASGVSVTPELALTLSAYYCGVTTIAYDLATLPLQVFKNRADGGKDLVKGGAFSGQGGIGALVYLLRWQPNSWQTATEFLVGQVAQYLLRSRAYAEIVDGPNGFLHELLPRHPDRVFPERLPSGRLRYRLLEPNGQSRYVTQEEMHVVRDMSTDPVTHISRVHYASASLGTALAADRAAGKFFKSGMTAALMATYNGNSLEDEDEQALHASITRYAVGAENNFGLLMVPDDVKVSNLAVDPDKAQMMQAREWTPYEVARQLRIPPRKLMVRGTATYASAVQDAIEYVVGCLRPIAHLFEQSIQRDLVLAKDTYFVKFRLQELLRGDPAARADYYSKAIENRWMWPSEVRLEEDLNPDAKLDQLSETDNKPGQKQAPAGDGTQPADDAPDAPDGQKKAPPAAGLRAMFAMRDNAVRCLRRERAAVTKLATKHANDPDGWQRGLRAFYSDHAGFVAEVMRLHPSVARGYAAQHGSEFELRGIVALADDAAAAAWERFEADELASLALSEGNTVEDWFDRRLISARVGAVTHIEVATPAVTVDARTTVAGAQVDARTTVTAPAIAVDARTTVQPAAAPVVNLPAQAAPVVNVKVEAPKPGKRTVRVTDRDPETQAIKAFEETQG